MTERLTRKSTQNLASKSSGSKSVAVPVVSGPVVLETSPEGEQAPPAPPPPPVFRPPNPPVQLPEPRFVMAYNDDVNFKKMVLRTFVNADDLLTVMTQIASVRFSVKVLRDECIELLERLVPVDMKVVLPDDAKVVDTTLSTMADLIQRIISGLDLGEREGEVNKNVDDKRLAVMKAAKEAINHILSPRPKLAALAGVYSVGELERVFKLTRVARPVV